MKKIPARAQYLTVPRSIIQEMPDNWQMRLAMLLEELDDTADHQNLTK